MISTPHLTVEKYSVRVRLQTSCDELLTLDLLLGYFMKLSNEEESVSFEMNLKIIKNRRGMICTVLQSTTNIKIMF